MWRRVATKLCVAHTASWYTSEQYHPPSVFSQSQHNTVFCVLLKEVWQNNQWKKKKWQDCDLILRYLPKNYSVAVRNHINIPFRDAVASLYDVPEAMNSALGEVFATHRDEGDTQRAVPPHVDLLAWTESPIDSDRLYKWLVTSPCSRLGKPIVAKPLKEILKFLDHKYPLPSSQELVTKRYR